MSPPSESQSFLPGSGSGGFTVAASGSRKKGSSSSSSDSADKTLRKQTETTRSRTKRKGVLMCACVCACMCVCACVCVYVSVGVAVLLKDRDGLGEIASILQFIYKWITQLAKHNGVLICVCVYLSVGVPVHLKDRNGLGEIVCIMEFIYKHITQIAPLSLISLLTGWQCWIFLCVRMHGKLSKRNIFYFRIAFFYVCVHECVCTLCMYVSRDLCRISFFKGDECVQYCCLLHRFWGFREQQQ